MLTKFGLSLLLTISHHHLYEILSQQILFYSGNKNKSQGEVGKKYQNYKSLHIT
jgi:hypothetical protein